MARKAWWDKAVEGDAGVARLGWFPAGYLTGSESQHFTLHRDLHDHVVCSLIVCCVPCRRDARSRLMTGCKQPAAAQHLSNIPRDLVAPVESTNRAVRCWLYIRNTRNATATATAAAIRNATRCACKQSAKAWSERTKFACGMIQWRRRMPNGGRSHRHGRKAGLGHAFGKA